MLTKVLQLRQFVIEPCAVLASALHATPVCAMWKLAACFGGLVGSGARDQLREQTHMPLRPAAGSFDGSVFVWELAGGTVAATLRGSGTSPVLGAAWSPQVPLVHRLTVVHAYATAAACEYLPFVLQVWYWG
jgi:hypothetical protein